MEKVFSNRQKALPLDFICLSLLGCGLITLSSFVKIPFYPVSFTLQTFAIFILALTQSPKQVMGSVLCYLLCATLGLPVLCGHVNSLWMFGKSAGYLLAFPLGGYLVAKLSQKIPALCALLCGQFVIYIGGFLGLVPFFGVKIAFLQGVLFFIPSDLLKNLMALGAASLWKKRGNV